MWGGHTTRKKSITMKSPYMGAEGDDGSIYIKQKRKESAYICAITAERGIMESPAMEAGME